MAYMLQVKLPNGDYKSLNILKSSKFDLKEAYREYNSDKIGKMNKKTYNIQINYDKFKYSLKMIDIFTMQFEDEEELKTHLIVEGILDKGLVDYPLVIRYISKKKEKRNYKVFYIDDLFYHDIDNLINLIESRYLNGDFKFLKALADNFRDFQECKTTASELYAFSMETLQTGYISKGFSEVDVNGDNVVRRLIKLLIFKQPTKNNSEVNTRTLHLLIEFIKTYEQLETKLIGDSKAIAPPTTPPKIKEKKPNSNSGQPLEGQMSFSDLFN